MPVWQADHAALRASAASCEETDVTRSVPAPGDFVVEYRHLSRGRGSARVAVMHLTHDAGPEELFSSNASRSGERAEGLAALWALEDGTCAWRLMQADSVETAPIRIAPDKSGA
jgi:hypothetical protein